MIFAEVEQIAAILSGSPYQFCLKNLGIAKTQPTEIKNPFFSIRAEELQAYLIARDFQAPPQLYEHISHGKRCGDGYSIYFKEDKWIVSYSERGLEASIFSRSETLKEAEVSLCQYFIDCANDSIWSWNNSRLKRLNLPEDPYYKQTK